MSVFRHHSYFTKPKHAQGFRFPFVCFACRRSLKFPASLTGRKCPQCREPMSMLSRKFAAPKSKDFAQWEKIKFLVEHGFRFHSVFETSEFGGKVVVPYPRSLNEAKDFVVRYKHQADQAAA